MSLKPILGTPSTARTISKLESVTVVWLDLAKYVFQLHGIDTRGAFVTD